MLSSERFLPADVEHRHVELPLGREGPVTDRILMKCRKLLKSGMHGARPWAEGVVATFN
jgi:hypothetical protein